VITPAGKVNSNYAASFGDGSLTITLAPLTFKAETSSNSFDGKTLITGSEPAGALPITVWVTVGGQTTLAQVSQTQANL
jgi:hypothetical protein